MKKRRKRHYFFKIVLTFAILLIAIRVALPYAIRYSLNFYLKDHIPGYTGHIDGFDLSLYRGAYEIEGLQFAEIKNHRKDPMLEVQRADISLLWKPLFNGSLVARVKLIHVDASFLKEPPNAAPNQSTASQWRDVLVKLIPIHIEQLEISDSEFHYRDFFSHPPVDAFIHHLHLDATNLTNTEKKHEELVSSLKLVGNIQNRGKLEFDSTFNLLKEPPSFDLNLSAKDLDLLGFNSVFEAYGGFEIHTGRFDFFSELASRDNNLKGYLKPMFSKVEVLDPEKKLASLEKEKHELGATLLKLILHNGVKDDVATEIPVEGTLSNPHFDVWAGIRNALHNAFGHAYERKLDHSVNIHTPPK